MEVSGYLVGEGSSATHSGVAALIFDSKGSYIGTGEGPLLSVEPGHMVPFKFSARVSGIPASCTVSWGFGPIGGSTGQGSGSGTPSGGT